jgi:hypothetical protein
MITDSPISLGNGLEAIFYVVFNVNKLNIEVIHRINGRGHVNAINIVGVG